MLTVGTTFSGIGAPEQALKNLGIPHVVKWACDIDKYAKQTYFANHTCEKWYDDIVTIDINGLEYVDLYIFGFPCTDISNMGAQDLSRGKSSLVEFSLRIIDQIQPKYILFENVKTLLADKFKIFFEKIKTNLENNYKITYEVLNSKNFGVPQNRERVFCVGINKNLDKQFIFDVGNPSSDSLENVLEENVSDFYLNKEIWYNYYNKNWRKEIGFVKINPDIGRCLTTRDFYNYRGTFISPFPISNTAKSSNKIIKETFSLQDKIRRLTERECARMQGFPDSFIIPVNDKQAYKQFGNTITITVLESIFKNLLL